MSTPSSTETLDAIRAELGCGPDADLVAEVREVFAASWRLTVQCMDAALSGDDRPAPPVGSALHFEHLGNGDAGVWRLAAVLYEARDGATVRDRFGAEWVKAGDRWVPAPEGGELRLDSMMLANCAPLSVLAWPA